MPFINVKILEGTTVEQKNDLVKEITQTFHNVTGVPHDRVFVFFEDLKRVNYGKHGRLAGYSE